MKHTIILLSIITLFLIGCSNQEPIDFTQFQCPDCVCPEYDPCEVCEECEECGEEQIIVTKYACEDGTIEDTAEACTAEPVYEFSPVTTNEEGSLIETANWQPACVDGMGGGYIYYKVNRVPRTVEVQAKTDPAADFETIYTPSPVTHKYVYFSICSMTCYVGDFEIDPRKTYLMRLKFDYGATKGGIEYSNEHIVDPLGSTYSGQSC